MKVPVTVITGFLGAGKTTLVRGLLAAPHGRRIALVINEFGDVGIDGDLLAACGGCAADDIVELANGCLCCKVADDFIPTMERLLDRPVPPDHIVIETSGLALPKPLVKAFDWPEIRPRLTVDGVIAVVDAAALAAGHFDEPPAGSPHENPLEEVFTDQLLVADMVVLNKADLLAPEALAALADQLRRSLRPGVKLVPANHGAVDAHILLGLDAAVEDDLAGRPTHHDGEEGHDHDDFESFAVTLPAGDPEAVEARLLAAIAAHDILRLKGFLHVPGKAMRQVVQAVGTRLERYYDRPWRAGEDPASRLVVIGLKGLDRAAITAALGA